VRARQDDERVVHQSEVSAGLAPSDLDERLGRCLARKVAAKDLVEVRLHPAMTCRFGRGREQVWIDAAGGGPVDHRPQDPRRVVRRGSSLEAGQIADVPVRREKADDQT
jgi:hypothetical protein